MSQVLLLLWALLLVLMTVLTKGKFQQVSISGTSTWTSTWTSTGCQVLMTMMTR